MSAVARPARLSGSPGRRLVEPVITPEQLAVDEHGRNAEDPQRDGLLVGGSQPVLDRLSADRRRQGAGVDADPLAGSQDDLEIAQIPSCLKARRIAASANGLSRSSP